MSDPARIWSVANDQRASQGMSGSSIKRRSAFALTIGAAALAGAAAAASPGNSADIARTIKADVAQLVAGLNAHDVMKTTVFDAPDIVSMEGGRPSSTGIEAERAGFRGSFAANPDWHVSMIDETVDVARAGDMAVYRGTYDEDSTRSGVPITHKVIFIVGFKRRDNGAWNIEWQAIVPTGPSHKK
jgi:ketosteroid isomerase-like protein